MSLVFDEYGRPFIILREQQQKARIKGLDAQKANILAARSVTNLLRTSLGPKGKSIVLYLNALPSITHFVKLLQAWTKCWLVLMER